MKKQTKLHTFELTPNRDQAERLYRILNTPDSHWHENDEIFVAQLSRELSQWGIENG